MDLSGTTIVDGRLRQARLWLRKLGVEPLSDFRSVAGDASFRRYFRVQTGAGPRILMDAPPPMEDVRPFIEVDGRLRAAGLAAPEIIHADPSNGFLLLEDLGDVLYRDLLKPDNAQAYFPALFEVLKRMALTVDARRLPGFDATMLRREMELFPEWYLGRHRDGPARARLETVWDGFCEQVIASALDQPRAFVHRDFHSCNLLRTGQRTVGIIDFQDAVSGPLSYDFVSLLWDRYIEWPRPQIEAWAEEFRRLLGLDVNRRQWLRYCDLMGLQRNIKIVGIFARLNYRDGKQAYIDMIPTFFRYVTETLSRYPEFAPVRSILEQPECAP